MLIVCALPCEAAPLIQHYRLKKQQRITAFPFYENADTSIRLIVSGMGQINAATATAYAFGQYPITAAINIGVAGAHEDPIGSGFLIQKITQQSTQQSHYPMAIAHFKLPSRPLLCVNEPQLAPKNQLVDMESTGYFQAANHFITSECIQLYKIVSDNAETPFSHDKKIVSALIENQLAIINTTIKNLQSLADTMPNTQETDALLASVTEKIRCTQYQRHALFKQLRFWVAQGKQQQLLNDLPQINQFQQLQDYLHAGHLR